MKKNHIPLLTLLLVGVIFVSGCTQQTTTPSETTQGQTEISQELQDCDSDWLCIKSALETCRPIKATLNFDDFTWGHTEGILEITGRESDTKNQRYGCGVNYETEKSTFSDKILKGHMIIEQDKSYDKLINLILSIEGYLEGSGQIIEKPCVSDLISLNENELPSDWDYNGDCMFSEGKSIPPWFYNEANSEQSQKISNVDNGVMIYLQKWEDSKVVSTILRVYKITSETEALEFYNALKDSKGSLGNKLDITFFDTCFGYAEQTTDYHAYAICLLNDKIILISTDSKISEEIAISYLDLFGNLIKDKI